MATVLQGATEARSHTELVSMFNMVQVLISIIIILRISSLDRTRLIQKIISSQFVVTKLTQDSCSQSTRGF